MSSINGVRGDVRIVLKGKPRRMRLTFGALAEIETELGIGDVAELAARLKRLSPQELWVVVRALLRAAGDDGAALVDHPREDVAQAALAVAAAFREAGA